LVAAYEGQVEAEVFGSEVTLRLTFIVETLSAFETDLLEATRGEIKLRLDQE
jgi:hypothetical protein